MKKLLWVEDDYYAIKGLIRPLQLEGYEVDVATSALEGYRKAQAPAQYDIIVVDLILPISENGEELPPVVRSWEEEEYTGIGLAKWLKLDLKVSCPVLMMSVVSDVISRFNLKEVGLTHTLSKKGLLPSRVKAEIFKILGAEE